MTTLVLGALEEEIADVRAAMQHTQEKKAGIYTVLCGMIGGQELYISKCGVGKVNAAAAASAILTAFPQIDRVINTGVAGGIGKGLHRGDVVVGTQTVQHDFDATADGKRKGQIEGFDSEFFASDPALCASMAQALSAEKIVFTAGVIASGDRFVADKATAEKIAAEFGAAACEMESAAIAQVCALYRVPFLPLRAISDGGDDDAIQSFYEFLHAAAANNARAIIRFLQAE